MTLSLVVVVVENQEVKLESPLFFFSFTKQKRKMKGGKRTVGHNAGMVVTVCHFFLCLLEKLTS